jgi:hypothetical protein
MVPRNTSSMHKQDDQCNALATFEDTAGTTSICSSQHREESQQKESMSAILCNQEIATSHQWGNTKAHK